MIFCINFGLVALLLPRPTVDVALSLDLAVLPLATEVGPMAADGTARLLGQLPAASRLRQAEWPPIYACISY